MPKAVTDIQEEIILRLEELKTGLLRTELQVHRLEMKIDKEPNTDTPITRAEIKTRDEVKKLCGRIEKLKEEGLL